MDQSHQMFLLHQDHQKDRLVQGNQLALARHFVLANLVDQHCLSDQWVPYYPLLHLFQIHLLLQIDQVVLVGQRNLEVQGHLWDLMVLSSPKLHSSLVIQNCPCLLADLEFLVDHFDLDFLDFRLDPHLLLDPDYLGSLLGL